MTTQEVKRKLAAILSADVKGYSRLMGEDEEGTIRTLNTYKEVMSNFIQQQRGRVVDAPGDNVLAEFGSVVDAVRCAVDIQKELKTRNADLPENRRMEFRIGVNLGDVVEDGEQILGDGVNIASRLESLSEVGGICISGTAYDQVENKLSLGYEYLGEQTVKNIAKPVRVYRVLMEPEAAGKVIGEKKAKPRQWQMAIMGSVIGMIVVVAAVVIWKLYTPSAPQPEVATKEKIRVAPPEKPPVTVPTSPTPSVEPALKEKGTPLLPEKVTKPAPPPAPKMEVASKDKMAFPLPDEPSIAVLPFVNMSEDPKQEFFADGITEEITTALSKVRHLFVISRESTFSYKGKPVKVKQVSEELGVRYVLEGSVQRSGDRIRINAQLIDALTGRHIWAERYNRDLTDLFALQDEITMRILTAIRAKLTDGEQVLLGTKEYEKYYKGKQGLDCYLKIMEGFKYAQGHNIEDVRMARRLAEETIAICPDVPMAYGILGYVHHLEYWLGSGKSPQDSIEKGIEMAQKVIALDDSIASAYAHGLLGTFYVLKREYDKAIAEGERSIALAPGAASLYIWYAMNLNFVGRPEEAIPLFQKAIRLNPIGGTGIYLNLGVALRMTGKFEEAVSAYRKAIQRAPDNIIAHLGLAATYSLMSRKEEARSEAAEVLRINPKFSVDSYAKRLTFKDQSITDKYIDALRKAGLK
jgi:adenylate cyclase